MLVNEKTANNIFKNYLYAKLKFDIYHFLFSLPISLLTTFISIEVMILVFEAQLK